MKAIMKTIDKLFDQASNLAIDGIRNEASEILRENSDDLKSFIMAMGSCFFTAKEGGKYDLNSYSDEEYDEYVDGGGIIADAHGIIHQDDRNNFQKEFFDDVDELNEKFHVMGFPMWLTIDPVDGSINEINNW